MGDAVAMQPHRHTPVGIAGMDEILRHIEVFSYDARKYVVGTLFASVKRRDEMESMSDITGEIRFSI